MSTIVYAVSSGCYSDYAVDCMFVAQADAQAYAERRNNLNTGFDYGFEVEGFDLYAADEKPELVVSYIKRVSLVRRQEEIERDQAQAVEVARQNRAREEAYIAAAAKVGLPEDALSMPEPNMEGFVE